MAEPIIIGKNPNNLGLFFLFELASAQQNFIIASDDKKTSSVSTFWWRGLRISPRESVSEIGKIADAVCASLSVPVLFEPYFHQETKRYLVDGGLTQNFPLDLAIEKYPDEKILGVNVANVKGLPTDFHTNKFFGRNKDLISNLQRTFKIFFQSQQPFTPDNRVEIIEPDLSQFSSATLSRKKFQEIMQVSANHLKT